MRVEKEREREKERNKRKGIEQGQEVWERRKMKKGRCWGSESRDKWEKTERREKKEE